MIVLKKKWKNKTGFKKTWNSTILNVKKENLVAKGMKLKSNIVYLWQTRKLGKTLSRCNETQSTAMKNEAMQGRKEFMKLGEMKKYEIGCKNIAWTRKLIIY